MLRQSCLAALSIILLAGLAGQTFARLPRDAKRLPVGPPGANASSEAPSVVEPALEVPIEFAGEGAREAGQGQANAATNGNKTEEGRETKPSRWKLFRRKPKPESEKQESTEPPSTWSFRSWWSRSK